MSGAKVLKLRPDIAALHAKLEQVAVKRDNAAINRAAKSGRYVNCHALALMLQRLDVACNEMQMGKSVARALYDNFNDTLLTAFEKAAGVPLTYGGGAQDKGRPA